MTPNQAREIAAQLNLAANAAEDAGAEHVDLTGLTDHLMANVDAGAAELDQAIKRAGG